MKFTPSIIVWVGFWLATVIASPAQVFTTLVSFNNINGANPQFVSLIQGTDGNLYGTTYSGGTHSFGTVFKITLDGTLTTLHSFGAQSGCIDGAAPISGLMQGSDGNFYGTTVEGGAKQYCSTFGCGTVFKISPEGALTTLYSFCAQPGCADGESPVGGLVQATDGNLYGTTEYGGPSINCLGGSCGTIFRITPAGVFTTLLSFDGTNGGFPFSALVEGADGNLYGTTPVGGLNQKCPNGGCGTVFKINRGGSLTTLYNFCSQTGCTDGSVPGASLIQSSNGNFYSTTAEGGFSNSTSCYGGCGTVFKITPAGELTTLHSFENTDGSGPTAPLVQGTDAHLYGTTMSGGSGDCSLGCGTIFRMTAAGTLTTLYNFCDGGILCTDGYYPTGGLTQDTNGKFYGTTARGGTSSGSDGTVFSLSVGLRPFIETRPISGKEGAKVSVLGQGFTSSSVVKFGGVQAATVSLNGSTDLIATIPAGALTGDVSVTTSRTTLTSNVPFRVTPQVLSFSPSSGPVGTPVTINGVGLKQTLGVGFGDYVPATGVQINSDKSVTATVPSGAKTGPVGVETKGGIGISSSTFTVTP